MHINIGKRLTDQISVYSAEMMAIIFGLQWVEEVRPDRVVLCVDSLAALQSIQSWNSNRQDLLLETQHSLYRLHRTGIFVRFCWVPAHVGIKGNEGADKNAKIATKMDNIIDIPFGKAEVKAILKKEVMKKWQDRWDREITGRNYYNIQKNVSAHGVKRKNRREETVLTRMRIGHTGLNKTLFLIGKSGTDVNVEKQKLWNMH